MSLACRWRRPLLRVAMAITVVLVPAHQRVHGQEPPSPAQRPVFRSNADLVTVPVFVKSSGGMVAGLKPGQFALTDNGEPQTVEVFSTESMPVDVTVLVETSQALEDYSKSVNKQVQKIASLVRPTDRLEILGISDYVSVLLPFGPPDRDLDVNRFASDGLTSVNDALVAALLREADPDRQHLIIAITDTVDTMSGVNMATVRRVAEQSSSTLVISWISMSVDSSETLLPGQPPKWFTTSERLSRHIRSASMRMVPRRQTWTPHYAPGAGRTILAFDPLADAAELTGGGLHPPDVFFNRGASQVFERIYNEFRRTYVLRYRPVNVDRNGWHDVVVTVPQYPDLDIRSRRGYYVEPNLSESTTSARVDAPTSSGSGFDDLLAAAGRDDLDATLAIIDAAAVRGDLSSFMSQLRDAGNCWPTQPAREFVLALALADAGVRDAAASVRQEGLALIRRYLPLVRPPLGPDPFERAWVDTAQLLITGPASGVPSSNTRPDIRARLAQLLEMGRQ